MGMENASFWKAPANEILDRPPGVVTAASPLRSLNRAANIREEFDEVVSRSSLSVSLSLSGSTSLVTVARGGFYDVCANVGVASPTYICREVIENIYRSKD